MCQEMGSRDEGKRREEENQVSKREGQEALEEGIDLCASPLTILDWKEHDAHPVRDVEFMRNVTPEPPRTKRTGEAEDLWRPQTDCS